MLGSGGEGLGNEWVMRGQGARDEGSESESGSGRSGVRD